jgi:hypothetical protein
MPTMWVATLSNNEELTVQVANSRAAALDWLVAQIPTNEWQGFFDALPVSERVGLERDKDKMGAEALLAGWVGAPAPNEPDVWGDGDYLAQILEQDIWSAVIPPTQPGTADPASAAPTARDLLAQVKADLRYARVPGAHPARMISALEGVLGLVEQFDEFTDPYSEGQSDVATAVTAVVTRELGS